VHPGVWAALSCPQSYTSGFIGAAPRAPSAGQEPKLAQRVVWTLVGPLPELCNSSPISAGSKGGLHNSGTAFHGDPTAGLGVGWAPEHRWRPGSRVRALRGVVQRPGGTPTVWCL
jgi:hypothetical protein